MRLQKVIVVGDESGNESMVKEYTKLLVAEKFSVVPPGKGNLNSQLVGASASKADVILVDINLPPQKRFIESLCSFVKDKLPVVLLTKDLGDFEGKMKVLSPLLGERNFEVMRKPVDHAEFRLRVKGVANRSQALANEWGLPELRADDTGRVSAILVAKYFGWELTKLSKSLGRSVQTVHKTPDSAKLQSVLEKLERAALLGRRCVSPDVKVFRKWLNASAPELDGERPGEMLLNQPDIVVQWLEDMALGQPG